MLPRVHRDRPEADGFCFSEVAGLTDAQACALAATGKLYATEFRGRTHEGGEATFCGSLIAEDWREAVAEAARRQLGERVLGVMVGVGTVR